MRQLAKRPHILFSGSASQSYCRLWDSSGYHDVMGHLQVNHHAGPNILSLLYFDHPNKLEAGMFEIQYSHHAMNFFSMCPVIQNHHAHSKLKKVIEACDFFSMCLYCCYLEEVLW